MSVPSSVPSQMSGPHGRGLMLAMVFAALLLSSAGLPSLAADLYSIDSANDTLLRINPLTGVATVIGPLNHNMVDVDLAFSSDGRTLYALNSIYDNLLEICKINPTTAQVIGCQSISGPVLHSLGEGLAVVRSCGEDRLFASVETFYGTDVACWDSGWWYSLTNAVAGLDPDTGTLGPIINYYDQPNCRSWLSVMLHPETGLLSYPPNRPDVDGLTALPDGRLLSMDRINDGSFDPGPRVEFYVLDTVQGSCMRLGTIFGSPAEPYCPPTQPSPPAPPLINDVAVACAASPDSFYSIDYGDGGVLRRHSLANGTVLDQVPLTFTSQPALTPQPFGLALACTCTPPPPDMTSWWAGEGDAKDSVGGNDGSITGGVGYSTGKVLQGFLFDGTSGVITVPDKPSLDITGAITLDAWVAADDVGGRLAGIVGKMGGDPATRIGYLMDLDPTGRVRCDIISAYPDSVGTAFSQTVVTNSGPRHVACSYDGSTISVYVDGRLEGSAGYAGGIGVNDEPLRIGFEPSTYLGPRYFQGVIDEVEVFHRALTVEEIQQIYLAGDAGKCRCAGRPAGLTAWWPGDGDALDLQGDLDGTLNGDVTFGEGFVGSGAFQFDGHLDYVSIPNPAFRRNSQGTLDTWVRLGNTTSARILMSLSTDGQTDDEFLPFYFRGDDGGRIHIALLRGGVTQMTLRSIDPAILDCEWHFLTLTSDGGPGGLKLYVDGVEKPLEFVPGEPTTPNDGQWFADAPDANVFTLGGTKRATLEGDFLGLLDEVEVFNRPLSAEEIGAIYRAGRVGKCKDQRCVDPPSGLTSWWSGDGTTADILSGENGVTDPQSAPTYGPGRVDEAFLFDGIGDHIRVPNPSFRTHMQGSVDAWVRVDDLQNARIILALSTTGTTADEFTPFYFRGDQGGKIQVSLVRSGTTAMRLLTEQPAITDARWHHLTLTSDGSLGGLKLYVDGLVTRLVADTDVPEGNLGQWFWSATAADVFTIGAVTRVGPVGPFKGAIDEVEVFSRPLTPDEVQAIYTAGRAGKCKTNTCGDIDSDGYGFPGSAGCRNGPAADCDDQSPAVHPGAVEVCNGVDDNCDGLIDNLAGSCGLGDCVRNALCIAGSESCTPGQPSPEVCDGRDNDCDGVVDDPPVPAASPFLTELSQVGGGALLTWPSIADASGYDIVRGDLRTLVTGHGNFTAALRACEVIHLPSTSWLISLKPAIGAADFYLVRPVNCGGNGSYDEGSGSQVGSRDAGINASPAACP